MAEGNIHNHSHGKSYNGGGGKGGKGGVGGQNVPSGYDGEDGEPGPGGKGGAGGRPALSPSLQTNTSKLNGFWSIYPWLIGLIGVKTTDNKKDDDFICKVGGKGGRGGVGGLNVPCGHKGDDGEPGPGGKGGTGGRQALSHTLETKTPNTWDRIWNNLRWWLTRPFSRDVPDKNKDDDITCIGGGKGGKGGIGGPNVPNGHDGEDGEPGPGGKGGAGGRPANSSESKGQTSCDETSERSSPNRNVKYDNEKKTYGQCSRGSNGGKPTL